MRDEMIKEARADAACPSLAVLEVGQAGKIVAIKTNDNERTRKLMALGVFPGMTVQLLQKYPAFVFQVGFTQIAVDRSIAAAILVETGKTA